MVHVDGAMVCPECGSSSYLVVDGREMTQYDLLHLSRAPKRIERHLPHARWCTRRRAAYMSDSATRWQRYTDPLAHECSKAAEDHTGMGLGRCSLTDTGVAGRIWQYRQDRIGPEVDVS